MIYRILPQIDSFINEYYPTKNVGIDNVLSIDKFFIGDVPYNSRILLKFDLADISSSISDGTIVSPKFYLNLYVTEATEIQAEYDLYIYAISQSWNQGAGYEDDIPANVEGVSWNYKTGLSAADQWSDIYTAVSYATNTTASFATNEGGGTWYIDTVSSQSFSFETGDINTEVTDIINKWLDSTVSNNGFIIKKSDTAEQDTINYGKLNFFSNETHTIYVPVLEIRWDDYSFSTGSLTELTDEETVVYFTNLKQEYSINEKPKLRIGCRSKYPSRIYTTGSLYKQNKYLPTSSYYEIRDAYTNEVFVPFDDTYTKLSCDSEGNYFRFWADMLWPERKYKIRIKIVKDGDDTIKYVDNDFIFKVVK